MKAKRLIALALAAVFMLSAAATPVFAAAALPQENAALEQQNDMVSIRLKATGDLVYGSNYKLEVQTNPADTQYIGVVVGVGGEANGYVTLVLSDKIRTLLKMIPLPKKMSKTPDQAEEFNVYSYLKQLIDGNDVSVLLRVADEAVSVMDVLHFYVPTIDQVSNGLRLALNLIRKYLPEGAFSRIYLDEQPVDAGNYVAGALALESSDMNTAGFAMFKIKPKTNGVRMYWAQQAEKPMTAEELQSFNEAAVLEVDGQVVPTDKIRYSYKKSGWGSDATSELPTEPGTYVQTAEIGGSWAGLEIAKSFLKLGRNVRIIEKEQQLLPQFDPEVSKLIQKELEAQGVQFNLGEQVRSFPGRTFVEQVQTNRGTYPCDLCVVAIGVTPNTGLLAGTGAQLAPNGAVLIGADLATSVPNIYAVGDCAACRDGSLRTSSLKVADLEIARTGLTETEARKAGLRVKSAMATGTDRPGICPNPHRITIKLVYEANTRQVLGAQAWGEKNVSARINAIAVAIRAGMTVEALGQVDFVYSSSSCSIWDPVQIVCGQAQ